MFAGLQRVKIDKKNENGSRMIVLSFIGLVCMRERI